MQYTRLYTGPDGETHFADVEVEFTSRGNAGELSALMEAKGVQIQRTHGESTELDWHTAPRRQFILQLSAATERQASDGEVRRFGPGTLILVEDTTGKGHITRAIPEGDSERLMLFIHL